MTIFWQHLFTYTFLQHALLAGLLASISCGIVGSFIVVRRTTYVAGAIAHCVLGGMGIAIYLQRVHNVEWITPLMGATIAAIVAALIISFVTLSGRHREDTVLSAVWAIGMAVGISFISVTPGYQEDLMSYLFGNILMVNGSDLIYMLILDLLIVTITILFYNKFLTISFQQELALLRGINVGFYHTVLLVMIALTVVLLTQVVGLIMVIALLTLPAATASHLAGRLWKVMAIATILCLSITTAGLAISYAPELPAGATIIELAGSIYILVLGGKCLIKHYKPKLLS